MASNKLNLESLGKGSNNCYTEYIITIIYCCCEASILNTIILQWL